MTAGSSARISEGANPCARLGSHPIVRSFAPVGRCSMKCRLIRIGDTPGLFVLQPVPHEGPAMVKEQFPLGKRADAIATTSALG